MTFWSFTVFMAIVSFSTVSFAQDAKPIEKPLEKTPEKANRIEPSKEGSQDAVKANLGQRESGREPLRNERNKENQSADGKIETINQKRQGILKLEAEIGAIQKSLTLTNIDHEVIGAISYLSDSGSVKAASSTSDTKISLSVLNIKGGYGYILGDHLEPYVEVDQQSATKKVDSFQSTQSSTTFSAALLVNLPIAEDALAGKKMVYATWIPYIGFMFTSISGSNESGADLKTTVSGNGMRSKLVAGVRYKLFERVALNSYVRFSFDQNSESAKSNSELGSSNSGQRAEVQLLGISIFI